MRAFQAAGLCALCLLLLARAEAPEPTQQQQQEARKFFASIDSNMDGVIEAEEAEVFVQGAFQGSEEDEGWTAPEAVHHMQRELDGADEGVSVSEEEVETHLKGMTHGHQVADWVEHGLNLPQYAAAFRRSAITALDFPLLVNDGGATLAGDLGVTSRLHQEQVLRGLKRVILGLGEAPSPPRQLACKRAGPSSVRVTWLPPERPGHPATHKFALQRQATDGAAAALASGGGWVTVGSPDDEDMVWVDVPPAKGKYRYRLVAWNAYGPSEPALSATCGIVRAAKSLRSLAGAGGEGSAQPARAGGSRLLGWSTLSSLAIILITLVIKASQLSLGDVSAKLRRGRGAAAAPHSRGAAPPAAAGVLLGSAGRSADSLAGIDGIGGTGEEAGGPGLHASSSTLSLNGAGGAANGQHHGGGGSSGGLATATGGDPPLPSAATEAEEALAAAVSEDAEAARLEAILRGEACAEPGCHRRFDRLRDMKRVWQRHYCGLCQRHFCLAHTRVSPHGPTGSCGLESKCLCGACFEELTPAQQVQYQRMNRLTSSTNGGGGNGALQAGGSRGGLKLSSSQDLLSAAAAAPEAPESSARCAMPEGEDGRNTPRRRWKQAGTAMRAMFRLREGSSQPSTPREP